MNRENRMESAEGSTLANGNIRQEADGRTQSRMDVKSRLTNVREAAQKDRKRQFTSLMHHLTLDLLRESFFDLKKKAKPGIDGVTWADFNEDREPLLRELHAKIHSGEYRPKPARRVHISKEDGGERPLAINCVDDKIVQQATKTLLECIYEADFANFSHGFRPGRNQHTALDSIYVGITRTKVNWALDMDISKFFDTVEHDWLIRFVERRIQDKRILHLLRLWMKVGVLDKEGNRQKARRGILQGSPVSPLLANIYLHYVFDLWTNKWCRQPGRKDVVIARYADDVIMGFQDRKEAEIYMTELKDRLEKFGLSLHPDKTRLIRFGRFAEQQCSKLNEGRPRTFDFLGFTHYCGKTRAGKFCLKRKTSLKKRRSKIREVKVELRKRLHDPQKDVAAYLLTVVRGHINYYAVPFNFRQIKLFVQEIKRLWYRALCRRSQKKNLNWKKFGKFVDNFLPSARISHPYPEKRFDAITGGRSRMR